MSSKKLLSKSRFKIALECPTKLYYNAHSEYHNKKADDEFLKALARGGFQVGELAKAYYPQGVDIQTLDKDQALLLTNEELKKERAVIFEAAVQVEDFLIRIDILIKNKNSFHLIEVKAKSFDLTEDDGFFTKRSLTNGTPKIKGEWSEYLNDIAFQKQVVMLAFPKATVTASLMLADKSKVATVDGLNQMFLLQKNASGQTSAVRVGTGDLGERVLCEVNVDQETNLLLSRHEFLKNARQWAHMLKNDIKPQTPIGSHCKGCEYQLSETAPVHAKSGFQECWKVPKGEVPVLKIWDFRKTDHLLSEGKKYISQVLKDDIDPQPDTKKPGLSHSERQWLQVEREQTKNTKPYIDTDGLCLAMEDWIYPLNFIDFETTMSALPFQKGRRPYEQLAFQFSHHVLHIDGRVEHAGEFIHRGVGTFPNFEFVRALKKSLSQNQGTVFRYSNHENTVLLQIHEQLQHSQESDRESLCEWIQTMTIKKQKTKILWQGPRHMVDLCELVKRYNYLPQTQGSNSIKQVLPAVIFDSQAVQKKFSDWISLDSNGTPQDPYKRLGPLLEGYSNDDIEDLLFDGEEIKDGGAASTAYAMMQFTQMSTDERERLCQALLKYCHLDTLAMVMLAVYWLECVSGFNCERS